MRGASQFGNPKRCESSFLRLTVTVGLAAATAVLLALPSAAQMHGPPSTTTIGGHFLAPPPSVTSIAGRHLPPPLPSVTSIPNFGFANTPHVPFHNGCSRGLGCGYWRGGLGYSVPYYVPFDASGYGYDYVGGPELYSGPPVGPNDPVFHIVIEQPPAKAYSGDAEQTQAYPPRTATAEPYARLPEAKPNEPSVLVFRDGHQQEVSNYAIMGQTVYVFDKRTQRIALADLDVPATIKANDDRGLEFNIPAQKPAQKKNSDLQPKSAPEQNTPAPANIASVVP
jgi:hypothetical protein